MSKVKLNGVPRENGPLVSSLGLVRVRKESSPVRGSFPRDSRNKTRPDERGCFSLQMGQKQTLILRPLLPFFGKGKKKRLRENLTLVVLSRSLHSLFGLEGTGVALNERGSDPKKELGRGALVWAEYL